jgi:putative transposase
MKKSRFTEEKIIATLREAEAGAKVSELCRRSGISEATLHNWKSRYGGMDVSQLRRLKDPEGESARLKRMYAEFSLTHHALQEVVARKP